MAIAAPTMDRLTLPDILADLDSLDYSSSLFPLSSAPEPTVKHVGRSTAPASSLLDAIASSSSSQTSMADYVSLSRQLRANFAEAQRLNSEPVSMEQVALLLPSERGKLWARSVTNAPKATRTDLLHAKVATLQTQIDDWDHALRSAVKQVDAPALASSPSMPEPTPSSTSKPVDAKTPSNHGTNLPRDAEEISPTSGNQSEREYGRRRSILSSLDLPSGPISLPEAPEFEDDDPWNDLS